MEDYCNRGSILPCVNRLCHFELQHILRTMYAVFLQHLRVKILVAQSACRPLLGCRRTHAQILQVFVQQNLTTSYESSNCTLNDTCERQMIVCNNSTDFRTVMRA